MIIPGVNCVHPVAIKIRQPQDSAYESVYNPDFRQIIVGCGHCLACKMKRTREWALRLIMEAQCWDDENICFTTLTYNDLNVPIVLDDECNASLTLDHREVQLFFKRLRKRLDYKISYFCVGEYGSRTLRPHHHAVIYGLKPCDWHLIEDCWNNGFVLTKGFYNETAGYVAGYIQKKLFGIDEYGLAKPPYLSCSQHIGEQYFWDNAERFCKQGYIVLNGFKYAIPRIFARKAVERGLLPAPDIDDIQLNQNMAIDEFMDWTDRNNIKLSDYERNFILIQRNHQTRQTLSRDLNEVV